MYLFMDACLLLRLQRLAARLRLYGIAFHVKTRRSSVADVKSEHIRMFSSENRSNQHHIQGRCGKDGRDAVVQLILQHGAEENADELRSTEGRSGEGDALQAVNHQNDHDGARQYAPQIFHDRRKFAAAKGKKR